MRAVDTSVAIAGFGPWHRHHEAARDVLDEGVALPAHALLETWAVLTGFPPPHRAPTDVVAAWLDDRFAHVLDPPSIEEHRALVRGMSGAERPGGAVYDALVGLTAVRAGVTLVTLDRRAADVYDLVDVEYRLVSVDR